MKKSASISIDLRKSNLVRVHEEGTIKAPTKLPTINLKEKTNNIFQNSHFLQKKQLSVVENEDKIVEKNVGHQGEATTIIHLKMINQCDKHENSDDHSSSKITHKEHLSQDRLQNDEKNIKIKSNSKMKDLQNERIKEFEINKQLERLKSETKKTLRKKNFFNSENDTDKKEEKHEKYKEKLFPKNFDKNSLKDGIKLLNHSRSSINGDSRTPRDTKNSEERNNKPLKKDQIDKIIRHLTTSTHFNNDNNSTTDFPSSPRINNPPEIPQSTLQSHKSPPKWPLRGPACHKRRLLSRKGPLSKKMKFLTQCGAHDTNLPCNQGLKWLLFSIPSCQNYLQGQYVYKDHHLTNHKEILRVCVGDDEEDEEEKYCQIGAEMLVLSNLSHEDINELKKQVKEEQRHKDNEHIMPVLMRMSWEQIESSYTTPSNLPDLTSDPTPTSPDDPSHDDDLEDDKDAEVDEEEDEEDVEFKSLDALYQEEFNKQGYKRLMDQLRHDPYQLENNFWQENNYDYKRLKDGKCCEEEVVTDYSKSRPKRSSVDYTPSAFTGIRYMEGGRPSRKTSSFIKKDAPSKCIPEVVKGGGDEEEKEEEDEDKEEEENNDDDSDDDEEEEEEESDDEVKDDRKYQNGDETRHHGGGDDVTDGGKKGSRQGGGG